MLDLLSVRAVCEGRRPVHVQQAGVITEDDTVYHPYSLTPPGEDVQRQRMLTDGESVAFYMDPLSFEDEGYLPKALWVQDFGGRRYAKRLSRKRRQELVRQIERRERLGPDVEHQEVVRASDQS